MVQYNEESTPSKDRAEFRNVIDAVDFDIAINSLKMGGFRKIDLVGAGF